MRLQLLAFVLVATSAQAEPAQWATPLKPLASFAPTDSGFVDDAFALSPDGHALAYIVTDGATQASLHVVDLVSKAEKVTPNVSTHAIEIDWLGQDRVMVIDRDPDTQKVKAHVFTSKGPTKEQLGPVDAIAMSTLDGKPVVVTYTKQEKKTVEHIVVAYGRDNLKPVARRTLREDAEGQVAEKGGPYKILWWRDGYTAAATLKAGEYDKQRDVRRPNRFARFEVLKGKIFDDQEIEDVLGFTQVSLEHKKHDGENVFVHLSDDHKKLLLTDGLHEHELKLARELFMYDANDFTYQLLDDGRLMLSATVDPTNPPAVQRKKADPDDLEIYLVDPKAATATEVFRIPGEGRGSTWRVSGGKIALLRKSKGFDRGGVTLEVHDLAISPTAASR